MAEELAIWLNDARVAVVQRERSRLRLRYTPEALDRYELGLPLLSLSLPLTMEYYPHGVTRAFLDGLLPEGESRRAIARDFGLRDGRCQARHANDRCSLFEPPKTSTMMNLKIDFTPK